MSRLKRLDSSYQQPVYDAIMAAVDFCAYPLHGMSFEEFQTQVWPATSYFGWMAEDGEPLVYLSIANRNFAMNSAEFGVVATEAGLGKGAEAFKALGRLAFDDLGIHRLHGVVLADNEPCLAMLDRIGVRREGVQKGARWKDGEWVDLIEYAATIEERELCLPQQQQQSQQL